MEPNTGKVKAMVAGPGFENSQYNIATSPKGRQMGSTWKIMTLAAALEAGYSPNDVVDGTSPCSFGQLGKTQNAEPGGGRMTLRDATRHSVNCAFARTELSVGFPKVIETAHKMGITQDSIDQKQVLTMTLGAVESTPLEMATATTTIASGGIHHPPLFVDRIEGPDGSIVFDGKNVPGDRAISQDTADCETDLMKGVITGGTGTGAQLNGRDAAGKTGTTDAKANAAFLGFTPQLAAFVWHGNKDANVPGAGFGGQRPASIWKAFMDRALAGQPAVGLPAPGPACARPGAQISPLGRNAGAPLPPVGGGGGPVPTTTPPTVVIQPTQPATTGPKNPCAIAPDLPVCKPGGGTTTKPGG